MDAEVAFHTMTARSFSGIICGMLRSVILVLILVTTSQAGCVWKLWQRTPIEEKVFDVYATVQSITDVQLVVQTKKGQQSFVMGPASIKGGDFGSGTYVHVYYMLKGEIKEVTMVVEKLK